jgi:hypothetical protein
MGPWGSGLVYSTIYLTILCEPVIFHLTCMETLRQVRSGLVLDLCACAPHSNVLWCHWGLDCLCCRCALTSCGVCMPSCLVNACACILIGTSICPSTNSRLECDLHQSQSQEQLLAAAACTALHCLQTFYMYNMSQATAFWIVSALIFPLSQVWERSD